MYIRASHKAVKVCVPKQVANLYSSKVLHLAFENMRRGAWLWQQSIFNKSITFENSCSSADRIPLTVKSVFEKECLCKINIVAGTEQVELEVLVLASSFGWRIDY